MAKSKIIYEESYKKGSKINKNEVLRMIVENIDKINIDMHKRTKYDDGTEGLTVEIRY